MNHEDFERLLLQWGYAFGPRMGDMQLSYFGDSPIAAFGQARTIRQTVTMDRGVSARRRAMGMAIGLMDANNHVQPAPAWAVEPVRCTGTRTNVAKALATSGPPDFSPEVMRVERAALLLLRADQLLGKVLRVEYCKLGGQAEKARQFELRRGSYRERVAEARGWMRRELTP